MMGGGGGGGGGWTPPDGDMTPIQSLGPYPLVIGLAKTKNIEKNIENLNKEE